MEEARGGHLMEAASPAPILDHLVHVKSTLQLKEGQGTWSCVTPALQVQKLVEKAQVSHSPWIEIDCLVRRPTGKGEVATCHLDSRMVYIVIEADDYIDPDAGRAIAAEDVKRGVDRG